MSLCTYKRFQLPGRASCLALILFPSEALESQLQTGSDPGVARPTNRLLTFLLFAELKKISKFGQILIYNNCSYSFYQETFPSALLEPLGERIFGRTTRTRPRREALELIDIRMNIKF